MTLCIVSGIGKHLEMIADNINGRIELITVLMGIGITVE